MGSVKFLRIRVNIVKIIKQAVEVALKYRATYSICHYA